MRGNALNRKGRNATEMENTKPETQRQMPKNTGRLSVRRERKKRLSEREKEDTVRERERERERKKTR